MDGNLKNYSKFNEKRTYSFTQHYKFKIGYGEENEVTKHITIQRHEDSVVTKMRQKCSAAGFQELKKLIWKSKQQD